MSVKTETDHPWREESTLRRLYLSKGKSAPEIANDLGCHPSTVFEWLDRHNIPRHTEHKMSAFETERTNNVDPPSDSEEQQIRGQHEKCQTVGNGEALHWMGCEATQRAKNPMEKDFSVFPPGYRSLCRVCLNLWRRKHE